MSLKAWYPFNGDFINYGVGDLSLTQVTTPTYVEGKIGKALNQGAFNWSAAQTASVLNNEELSICFWIYVNTATGDTTNRGMIFGGDNGSVANRRFSLFQYPTANDFHWSWSNGEPSTFAAGIIEGVFPSYTWTHCCITYKNPNGAIYINGQLKKSFTGVSNVASFATETKTILNVPSRYLNDFRVYDHCLSPKEVKELSKGLCLHYTLNNGGLGCPNLATNTYNNTSWSWSMQAGDYTKTYEEDAGGKWCVLTKGTATAQSGWSVLQWSGIGRSEYVANTKYTVSFEVIPSHNCTLSIKLLKANGTDYLTDAVSQAVVANKVNKVEVTLTTVATLPTSTDQIIYITGHNSSNGVIYKFRKVKIEKGEKATAWCPNKADAQYGIFTSAIECDTSGYRNNGTKVGTIEIDSDTPRYSSCSVFNGDCANYIKSTSPLNFLTKALTVNCWVYQTATTATSGGNATSNLYIVSNGRDHEHYGFGLRSNNGIFQFWIGGNTTGNVNVSSGVNIANGWHMVTGTWDGATAKVYVDGVLKASKACAGIDYTHVGGAFVVGKMSYGHTSTTTYFPFSGKISDVRVYSTTLSDSDIMELYNAPIAIDNGATMYAIELKEVY